LSIVGRIVNCVVVESEAGNKYDIGIEFIGFSDKDRELIRNFLNTLEDM